MQAYKAAFTAALEAEHTEEWQLAEERLKSWPQQRLKVPCPLLQLPFACPLLPFRMCS